MAKQALAGEMRTKITIEVKKSGVDADGYPTEGWIDVFGKQAWCKWVNAHGAEIFDHMRLDLKDVATITMRYSALVNAECRIWRENDDKPYEIISIDNVDDARKFLEIKVKRMVKA